MYGMNTAIPASGAAFAYTGLNLGAGLLTALGIMLIGAALVSLVRRNPAARP